MVFIDLVLPEMPGDELLEAMANIEERTQFIIASGQVGVDRSKWTAKEHVLGYLSKPFSLQSVLEIIRQLEES